MSNAELLLKISCLEDNKKNELNDFIEFLLYKDSIKKKHPKAGFLKNTFKINEGFDDIPDDFKDYIK